MVPRAVFLDKDGTLVEDIPYNVDPALIRLNDRAIEALKLLQEAGYSIFVVTNQSGVARGYFSEQDLSAVERRIHTLLMSSGILMEGFYYCPHHPQGTVAPYAIECICRKPRPGLLLKAAHEHNIDLASSWLVGDILNDVQAGKAAGCRTVLLANGHETEWDRSAGRQPDFTVTNLLQAAQAILRAANLLERSFPNVNKQE